MPETTTSRARVQSALAYQGYDRLPTFYQCTPEFDAELCARLGVSTGQRDAVLGVDMKDLDPDYVGPELLTHPDGSWDGIFGERYANIPYENGTYPEAVYLPYAGISDPADLDRLPFPSPDWYDYSTLPAKCAAAGEYALAYGGAMIPDFMNGIARRRGVGQVLLDIGNQDPVYLKLMAKTHEFWIEWCERGLRSAGGRIDILALGEDYGSQRGLLISPRTFDRLFRPYMQQYIDLAHKYGARAMMHSCGSVRALIPRFIDMGLDILDVVQVDAVGMDIRELHREFYGKIAFRGTLSVQSTLPFGTMEDVRREVELRAELFRDGGLICGPTHQIQPLTPVENVLEMYRTIGSLQEELQPAPAEEHGKA